MRRILRHGLAGVGAATLAVVAGVTAFGAPTTVTVSGPPPPSVAPGEFVPVQYVPADPAADAQRAATAAQDDREAERARVVAASAEAAYRREVALGAQGREVAKRSAEIEAAKKRAEQAAAEAAAAAERARQAAIANQGYTPGTTDVRDIARQILANKFSYGDEQLACFSWIIGRESGWDVHAENASSGAYGLPQALPGSKMASVAPDWRDNPATQIIWGVSYMKSRYGSPCDAKSYWESHGNY